MEGLPLLDISSTREALRHAGGDADDPSKVAPESSTDYSSLPSGSVNDGLPYVKEKLDDRLTYAPARRRLSLALVLPTLIVVLITAGTATALLVWLLAHKRQQTLHDVWTMGAFVLDEGTKLERGNQAARLTGLTISSIASTAVALTGPVLMGLYAYNIAYEWLEAGYNEVAKKTRLPSPVHYGLMIQLLVGGGPISLLRTSSFLVRGGKSHRNALLVSTFAVALVVFVLTHAVSAVDLWLHTTVSAISQNFTTSLTSALPYGIGQNACSPYPTDPEQYLERIYPCLYGAGSWANLTVKTTGMTIAANASTDVKAITLADAEDLAVLVPSRTDPNILFSAPSFGARASCQSLNSLCGGDSTTGSEAPLNCSSFSNTFPPIRDTKTSMSLNAGESKLFVLSSNCDNCTHVDAANILSTEEVDTLEPSIRPHNSYNLWMEFVWMDDSDQPFGRSPPGNDAVWNTESWGYMLVNCSLSFYNVTLSSSKGEYFLEQEMLTDPGISDGFAAPTRLAHFSSQLIANVQGPALTLNTTDRAMAALSQDLARLAIGSAGALANLRVDTIKQESINEILVGWYPIAPIIVFLVLLYGYATLALGIFIRILFFTRSSTIHIPNSSKSVSAMELAAMRLTNPLTLVAALFLPEFQADPLMSVETNVLKSFKDNWDPESRLRVGLQVDEDAFGVWSSAVKRPGYSSAA
ncbi:hypothetical protein BDY19DRAFT_975585 [Irpex rosettiformis]|uniref:Uncharacterized protein n=1 Tax=Irpex rosettiformis TaxID=378272 RepID=A0ACB8TPR6_9APHY|nr:hypothetical protein BDY19DRAFT_975585 [Irpex rosettiformis]